MKKNKTPTELSDVREQKEGISKAFDDIIVALHSPKALTTIKPQYKLLLDMLRDQKVKISDKVTDEMIVSAKEADDHYKFDKTFCSDLASIETTLEINSPIEFYSPVVGGDEFLIHVLNCSFCLLLICRNKEVPKNFGDLLQAECNLHGIKIKREREGKKLTDEVEFPKPS